MFMFKNKMKNNEKFKLWSELLTKQLHMPLFL